MAPMWPPPCGIEARRSQAAIHTPCAQAACARARDRDREPSPLIRFSAAGVLARAGTRGPPAASPGMLLALARRVALQIVPALLQF